MPVRGSPPSEESSDTPASTSPPSEESGVLVAAGVSLSPGEIAAKERQKANSTECRDDDKVPCAKLVRFCNQTSPHITPMYCPATCLLCGEAGNASEAKAPETPASASSPSETPVSASPPLEEEAPETPSEEAPGTPASASPPSEDLRTQWTYTFDGCPRDLKTGGPPAGGVMNSGRPSYSFEGCASLCGEGCEGFEATGCTGEMQCDGSCYTFAQKLDSVGSGSCDLSGHQRTYFKASGTPAKEGLPSEAASVLRAEASLPSEQAPDVQVEPPRSR